MTPKTYSMDVVLGITIPKNKIIHFGLNRVKEYLEDNISDPVSSSRPSDSKFITTAWHEKHAHYPTIVVSCTSFGGDMVSIGTKSFRHELGISVDVLDENSKRCDLLTDDVLYWIKQGKTNSYFVDYNMILFNSPTVRYFDMDPRTGKHRKIVDIIWLVYDL